MHYRVHVSKDLWTCAKTIILEEGSRKKKHIFLGPIKIGLWVKTHTDPRRVNEMPFNGWFMKEITWTHLQQKSNLNKSARKTMTSQGALAKISLSSTEHQILLQIGRNSHVQSRVDDEKFIIAIFFVMHDNRAAVATTSWPCRNISARCTSSSTLPPQPYCTAPNQIELSSR